MAGGGALGFGVTLGAQHRLVPTVLPPRPFGGLARGLAAGAQIAELLLLNGQLAGAHLVLTLDFPLEPDPLTFVLLIAQGAKLFAVLAFPARLHALAEAIHEGANANAKIDHDGLLFLQPVSDWPDKRRVLSG
ncbi:hypothetical protein [Xanthobacter agilis]|uniref:Uncharacterized protein n=1 Tax=Xanthobacter agilis TaxID=47492 RepID=A0ABU0LH14_XANAG|nr:hypothetical protein [Xanthobacter agilis]MDQ0506414.1 hypothetical protein [Xanthobacter agilis]